MWLDKIGMESRFRFIFNIYRTCVAAAFIVSRVDIMWVRCRSGNEKHSSQLTPNLFENKIGQCKQTHPWRAFVGGGEGVAREKGG